MLSSAPKWVGDLLEGFSTPVKVIEDTYITPQIKTIRFQGNISRMDFQIGYAIVIRVSEKEFRNYTVAYHDTKAGILDIIFHIHGNGIGSRYIDELTMGDELYISIPRGQKQYNANVKKHFIFGDETSLGLACSFLPELKKNNHQFQYCFELDECNKTAPKLLGLENYVVFTKNGSFQKENWIAELPISNTPDWLTSNFILTGNARSVQTFRRVLKDKKISGKIFTKGFWLEGKTGL
ncbi:MAG: siderophore-interacting protein [Sphingobacteriales bacterium]|nr:MAG: siderophore-interacting protein [Sphingobacteriales bacterium]